MNIHEWIFMNEYSSSISLALIYFFVVVVLQNICFEVLFFLLQIKDLLSDK